MRFHSAQSRATERMLLVVAVLAVAGVAGSCQKKTGSTAASPTTTKRGSADEQDAPRDDAAIERQVGTFCGNCHRVPKPDYFPRGAWHDEVERGFGFYLESGRRDLTVPPMNQVVSFFQRRAPETLPLPALPSVTQPTPVQFAVEACDLVADPQPPGTAHVMWATLRSDEPPRLVTCDMRSGEVRAFDPSNSKTPATLLARLRNPCHAELCDWDRDGTPDLLVADLGSFDPADHDRGRIVWLRQTPDVAWQEIVLAADLGRVADVRPADIDGDGDLDLFVAEFGWHKTGHVLWLENVAEAATTPRFERHVIDPRPGAIHVPVCDLNGDGRPDMVALVSQEFEEIVAFINRGDGSFEKQVIGEAEDPAFGSSGIELVDLDQDGDLDVLSTNGDTFDSKYVKPYHGIQWLENRGEYPFRKHRLVDMVGAFRAAAGDLDGDGDLDLVAVGFLPKQMYAPQSLDAQPSVLWLEQTLPGQFVPHRLQAGEFEHATLELADFDGDGDLDLAIGTFRARRQESNPRLTLWWNQRLGKKQP